MSWNEEIEAVCETAKHGDFRVLDAFIKQAGNVNVVGRANWTLLHEAAKRGYLVVAEYLLMSGADVNVTTDHVPGEDARKTPLHWAVKYEHLEMVKGGSPLNASVPYRL